MGISALLALGISGVAPIPSIKPCLGAMTDTWKPSEAEREHHVSTGVQDQTQPRDETTSQKTTEKPTTPPLDFSFS